MFYLHPRQRGLRVTREGGLGPVRFIIHTLFVVDHLS